MNRRSTMRPPQDDSTGLDTLFTNLTVKAAAELLTKASKRKITAAQIRQDVEVGAPMNSNGTIHLVNYTAWLALQTAKTR